MCYLTVKLNEISSQLTSKDVALEGLVSGKSRHGLKIVSVRGKGCGVITEEPIPMGSYVAEYKYGPLHTTLAEKKKAEEDYRDNNEGSYILEVYAKGKRCYLDATRRFKTYGR